MPAKLNPENFIKKLKDIFNDQFDFSEVNYIDMKKPVVIGCKIHGKIKMDPQRLIYKKIGCTSCNIEKANSLRRDTKEIFVDKCLKNLGDKYSFDKVTYVNSTTLVTIGCPKHGYVKKNL